MKHGLAPLLASLLILLPLPSHAKSAGSAAANFLKMGQGARAVGMGESHVAVAEDAYAAYWNPAGLASMEYAELALNYNRALEGVDQQFVSFAYPLRYGSTLNLNLTRLGMTSFQGYDARSTKTDLVSSSDLALGAAYGRGLFKDRFERSLLDLGVNLKFIHERLDTAKADAFAADAGAILHLRPRPGRGDKALDRGFRVGLAAKNLGPGLKFDRDRSELPTSYQLGLAWRAYPRGDSLTLSLDQSVGRDEKYHAAFGVEYTAFRMLALRLGYRTGQDIGLGFRGGVGFRLKGVELNYAFAGFGDLGQFHRVGLSFRIGGPVEVTPPEERVLKGILDKGNRLMREGRYYEAVLEYDTALELDPGNKIVLDMMRQANERLKR